MGLILVARIWPRLAFGLVEGLYIPGIGRHRLASAAALTGGLLIGGVRLGFTDLYTESIILTAALLAAGIVLSGMGAKIVVGIAAGDITVTLGRRLIGLSTSNLPVWPCAAMAASLLLVYALLFSLTVFIPQSARYVAGSLRLPSWLVRWRVARAVRLVMETALTVFFVLIWSGTAPLLTQPLFTWNGRTPPPVSPDSLSRDRAVLLIVSVGACVVRAVLRGTVPRCGTAPCGYAAVRARVRERLEKAGKRPRWMRAAHMTWQMTFMLSGLCHSWLDGALLAALLAICYTAHFFAWLPSPRLAALLGRLHAVSRVGMWVGVVSLFAWAMAGLQPSGSWPAFAMAAVSIVTFSVFLGPRQKIRPA